MAEIIVRFSVLPGLLLAVAAAHAAPPQYALPAMTTPDFCGQLQVYLEGSREAARNVVHTDYAAFVTSKPELQPLRTQQFVEYSDAARSVPVRISCKLKTGDHLNAVSGAGAASDTSRTCRDAHQQMVLAVWASMTRAEMLRVKFNPDTVMLDGDDIRYTGASWKEPYQDMYMGADQRPHFISKALYAGWTDWRWKFMPAKFRGTHYCHLVAPETMRRVMLGELTPPPGPAT